MHLSSDKVLEKCRIGDCGGLIIERPSTGEIYCTNCYHDYKAIMISKRLIAKHRKALERLAKND